MTDVKAPKQRSFDELRASIEADLKTQQAQRKFAETAEAFTNGVYEQSDSLKPVADKLKLEIKTASELQRKEIPGAKGVLANPKFLAAVFSADSLEKKRNTEAVEVGPNQLAAARVIQYAAARTRPLTEVQASGKEPVVVLAGSGHGQEGRRGQTRRLEGHRTRKSASPGGGDPRRRADRASPIAGCRAAGGHQYFARMVGCRPGVRRVMPW